MDVAQESGLGFPFLSSWAWRRKAVGKLLLDTYLVVARTVSPGDESLVEVKGLPRASEPSVNVTLSTAKTTIQHQFLSILSIEVGHTTHVSPVGPYQSALNLQSISASNVSRLSLLSPMQAPL